MFFHVATQCSGKLDNEERENEQVPDKKGRFFEHLH